MRTALVASLALVAACASSTNSAPACHPDGTYEVTPKRTGGNCPDAATQETPYTVTIATDGAGHVSAGLETSGDTCSGTIDSACKATIACTTALKLGGSASNQISWTFTSSGLSGSTSVGYQPASAPNCIVDYTETGSKK